MDMGGVRQRWPDEQLDGQPLPFKLYALTKHMNGDADCDLSLPCFQGRVWTPPLPNASFDYTTPMDPCCISRQIAYRSVDVGRFSVRTLGNEANTQTATEITNSRCVDRNSRRASTLD